MDPDWEASDTTVVITVHGAIIDIRVPMMESESARKLRSTYNRCLRTCRDPVLLSAKYI